MANEVKKAVTSPAPLPKVTDPANVSVAADVKPISPVAAATAEPVKPKPPRTGHELGDYLDSTGTGASRLMLVKAYLKNHDKATGKELYVHCRDSGFPVGTVRKMRDWLCQNDKDPEERIGPIAEDELEQLRSENATLRGQLLDANAKNAMLLRRQELDRDRLAEMSRQVRTENAKKALDFEPSEDVQRKNVLDFQPSA